MKKAKNIVFCEVPAHLGIKQGEIDIRRFAVKAESRRPRKGRECSRIDDSKARRQGRQPLLRSDFHSS